MSEALVAVAVFACVLGCARASEPAPARPAPTPAPAVPIQAAPTPAAPTPAPKPAAGGFTAAPAPILVPHENSSSDRARATLDHGGATVIVGAHVEHPPPDEAEDEYAYRTVMQLRVEFGELGLEYSGEGVGGDDYCDELVPAVNEIATLDDGRWIVDAQLACRAGEDYFWASNDHVVSIVDTERRSASVLWTGRDTGENAMGVCSSSSVHAFTIEAGQLVVRRRDLTTLDREAALDLPEAAEGCEPQPKRDVEVTRVELPHPGAG
jgi:hypothetical protein